MKKYKANRSKTQGQNTNRQLYTLDNWETKKQASRVMASRLHTIGKDKRAARMGCCADTITSGVCDDCGAKYVHNVSLCRDRLCPICAWRRSRVIGRKIYEAVECSTATMPNARYILLTLTVRNCPWGDLGKTIRDMLQAWSKLTRRVKWRNAITGWSRTVEITRGKDGLAHPHIHALIQVPASYFWRDSVTYISHETMVGMWQACLGVDYAPSVDIRAVARGKLSGAIAEVSKYLAKGYDVDGLSDDDFARYVAAIKGVRVWACGGNLKLVAGGEEEDVDAELVHADGEETHETCRCCGGKLHEVRETWDNVGKRYAVVDDVLGRERWSGPPVGTVVKNIYVGGDMYVYQGQSA